nr:hypothetical protein [Tanacetum cinerariifolium]
MITGREDGSSRNIYSKLSRRCLSSRSVGDLKFSSTVIAMNLSNSKKNSSSRRVPLMKCRILLPSSRRASKSSSKISSITSILNQVSSFDVKKGSSQDERNFAIFFRFKNNKIGRKGLRVSRDSFAYKEYGIRLMLAPRSAKALQEKVLLIFHGIRKLSGSPSFDGTLFWIIAELSSLRKAAEICSVLYYDHGSFGAFLSYEAKNRNSDCEIESRSDNTVKSPHRFIIYWIVISKNIKKVTEVVDVKNWQVDNSRVLWWIVSLIEWNSSISSTKSSIQSTFSFRWKVKIRGED